MMDFGNPKMQIQLSKSNLAIVGAGESSHLSGMNFTNLENRSTIEKIASKRSDRGKCVMKSRLMDSKQDAGTGNG